MHVVAVAVGLQQQPLAPERWVGCAARSGVIGADSAAQPFLGQKALRSGG